MNYDEIPVDEVVNAVVSAAERGELRPATKSEALAVRLAALSGIVQGLQTELQAIGESEREAIFLRDSASDTDE
ncbi:MAG: hypothetical protein LBT00_06375 [Spirochaetaceae bacterium]|jgi:hypothetical protein|nr:hypothetical protein [Spirochaetaceae bacterium]